MSAKTDSPQNTGDCNSDPLTGEKGAHPVATGVGAATVGAAGLAASAMVAGPVGVAAATIGGAVIGGYVGKAAGELIDPTVEDAFWREQHPRQPYAEPRVHDDDYFAAYRVGYVGYSLFEGEVRSFEEAEPDLQRVYEETGSKLPWEKARVATRAAWDRVDRGDARRDPPPTTESQHAVHQTLISESLQSGALSNAQMPR